MLRTLLFRGGMPKPLQLHVGVGPLVYRHQIEMLVENYTPANSGNVADRAAAVTVS